jgi:hypothetical protein
MNKSKRPKYQCIGGPLCGTKISMKGDGWLAVCSREDPLDNHYYRMCVVENQYGQRAQFWHYIGNKKRRDVEPKVFPSRRHFR